MCIRDRSTRVRRGDALPHGRLVLPRRTHRRPRGRVIPGTDPFGGSSPDRSSPPPGGVGAVRGRRLSWASVVVQLSGDAPRSRDRDRHRVWWPGRRSGRAGRGEEGWHVDPDSGAHRTGNREALEVVALRPGRLGPVDRVEQGGQVLGESLLAEARLAERDVNDPALVDLELDPAALDLAQGTITF